jgi:protein-S-isoprenylcysteine O-methyltransferase Ste14
MGLDIRWPIGALLAVIGAILVVFGVLSDPALYERSLGLNVNTWWGAALLLVGGAMLALARRARPAGHAAPRRR